MKVLLIGVVLVTMHYIETGFGLSFAEFTEQMSEHKTDVSSTGGQESNASPEKKKGCRLSSGHILGFQKKVVFWNYCGGVVCTKNGTRVTVTCQTPAGIKCRKNTDHRFPNCCPNYKPCPGAPATPPPKPARKPREHNKA
uniref:Putative 8.9kda superfamily 67 8.9 kDa family n=1 Tax=Amblyomma americanum TaxID=6943 RepID=A0A0C9S4G2_AMBAM